MSVNQLLVVVSILEGRHFPKSPRLSLLVQASFDGEHLCTDPVDHREQPQFNTELAWELDRRTLHRHRLQRTPIKLQCFTVDSVSKKKESVGYIVLDLRSVQEVKQEPRWCPLLSSKYTKQKPALLISAVLENDNNKPSEPSPDRFKAKKAPPRQGSPAVTDLLPEELEATLVPDQGYHQVGPADLCCDMFVLSVTVAFATRLEQLIPSSLKLSAEGSDFFFYYTLLGNDITSEPFHNLLSPDFEPERASVRIRSSKQVLQRFLSQQPALQIHLCCGNQSLGSTDVPLSGLGLVSVDVDQKVATLEGAFVLQPPRRVRPQTPLAKDLQPTVGVSVTLRREEDGAQSSGNRDKVEDKVSSVRPEPRPRSSSPVQKKPPPDSSAPPPAAAPPAAAPPAAAPPAAAPPSSHTESEAESLLEEVQHRHKDRVGLTAAGLDFPVHQDQDQGGTEGGAAAAAGGAGGASSVSVSAPKVSIPASAHHYCFSLDLRSLGNLSLTHPIAATLRYSYQFFGSAAPIMTSPPVELQRNMEASLPQSFCAFDFAALPAQVQDTFLRVPLLVELWHRDSCSRDQLIGRASVQLCHLLRSERSRQVTPTGETSWRQTHRDRIPVVHMHSPGEKVADLSYLATLDDLGLVKTREVIVSDSSQTDPPLPTQPPPSLPAAPPPAAPLGPAPPSAPPPGPRETLEYRTALELEMWKEEQEEMFDHQLRKKELSHMSALAEEWRRRDREREALVHKKEVEYNVLEEKLRKTLTDLEKREKQLIEAELETQRLQKELRAEHELALKEVQEQSRRLQQESEHRAALERDKSRLMEEERGRLLQQISDAEFRYKHLEKEFHVYRDEQSSRPEIRLQSHINILTLEKVELERKLESTTKSKLHYKQQWGRALKELARFKQREQENAMLRLKKQQEELEAMRLRYLATEQKEEVQQEKQELDDIRNELNRLKQQERSGPAPSTTVIDSCEEHLSRLLEERDTLLRTGVYTHDDRIIAELNRQIQDAMTERGAP